MNKRFKKLLIRNVLIIQVSIFMGLCSYITEVVAQNDEPVVLVPVNVMADLSERWEAIVKTPLSNNLIEIDRKELERSIQRDVNETLRGRPGITMTVTNEGNSGQMELRGVVAGQNAITFDGVPLLSILPGENLLSYIPGEAIDQITVNTGSDHAFQSFQGGTGSVRLSSRIAERNNVDMHVEGGTFASLRETVSGGMKGKLGQFQLVGNRSDIFDGSFHAVPKPGQEERDPARNSLGIANFGTALTNKATLSGSVLYRNGHFNFDINNVGADGVPTSIDSPDTWIASKLWLTQTTLRMQATERWLSNLQLGFTRNEVTMTLFGSPYAFATQLMFADWKNSYQLLEGEGKDSLRLIWGGHLRQDRGELNNPGTNWTASERTVAIGFAELQGQWRNLYTEAGVRLEHQSHYAKHVLLHYASHWNVNDVLTLRAKAGNSFRPPDYGELYNAIAGDLNLPPERGVTADTGFDWNITKNLQVSLTGFYSHYSGMVNLEVRPDKGYYAYRSIARAETFGVESSLKHVISPSISHGINYTYLDGEDLDKRTEIAMRTKHNGRYWAEWQGQTLPVTLRLTLYYRSGLYAGAGELYPINDAVRLSLFGSYRVSPMLDFYIRGENLNGDRTVDAWTYNHSGATVYGGLHVKF